MSSLHRISVLGRTLQVRSAAPPEEVRDIEEFVNRKLAEVSTAIKGSDPQLVAILALMNIAEEYLSLRRGNEVPQQPGVERLVMLLRKIEDTV